jgi:7,8-dihydropterin-6-yl-methyl-4-(beta-D-ribofuranosyl)aminobenzene 5'-phosphate synthase
MSAVVRITCLVNDAIGTAALPVEHGLSLLIENGGRTVLFDTGQTGLVVQNALQLGFDLAGTDHIVLSHGHYDHTGGLKTVLEVAPHGLLFTHPAAFERKFSRSTGQCRDIGMPNLSTQDIYRHGWTIVKTFSPMEVTSGIHATGPIPRVTTFEDVGGPFFLDEAGTQPDPIVDDQALYFMTREGVVVLLGCAHAGVINTLNHIHRLTRGARTHAVIGGMHLLNASPIRLAATTTALQQFGVRILAPCHCTGSAATDLLRTRFSQQCRDCGVGSQFSFDLS